MNRITCQVLDTVLSKHSSPAVNLRTFATKLMEVGHLDAAKTTDSYEVGQLFLHRLFGYRGVILHPWSARVFDRDTLIKVEADVEEKHKTNALSTFYNVLIDTRDRPFVRALTSAVTVLRHSDNQSIDLYTIPDLDYASHQDVLPYTSSPGEEKPLQNQLAEQFFGVRPGQDPPFTPNATFLIWLRKNRQLLEVSEVHRQTTEKIRVTVIPFFLGHLESDTEDEFWWRYWICLENTGDLAVRLRERSWRVFSETGALEAVKGRGVVGQEPVLSPGLPAFQYTSHVVLQAPLGHMWGTLRMEREDGQVFNCTIPKFSLKSRELDDSL